MGLISEWSPEQPSDYHYREVLLEWTTNPKTDPNATLHWFDSWVKGYVFCEAGIKP